MNKISKAQKANIVKAVDSYFNGGVSLDDTAMLLTQNGIGFTAIQETINKVAIENDWLLTDAKIEASVKELVKGKTISHFLDIAELASQLNLKQLSDIEKQKAIRDFSGVSASVIKQHKKFKQFNNSGHMGKLADWVKAHPSFTPEQIKNCNVVEAPNAQDYYEEMLAYRQFFKTLYGFTIPVDGE